MSSIKVHSNTDNHYNLGSDSTLNNFMFNCKNNLQITGCLMGTACAQSYTKISLVRFEEKHTYSFIKNKV